VTTRHVPRPADHAAIKVQVLLPIELTAAQVYLRVARKRPVGKYSRRFPLNHILPEVNKRSPQNSKLCFVDKAEEAMRPPFKGPDGPAKPLSIGASFAHALIAPAWVSATSIFAAAVTYVPSAVRAFAWVAVAAFVSSSQAAVYVGNWIAPYGDPFGDLGWRGEVQIDAPTNCGAATGFSGVVTCSAGAATVSYAFVEFYSLSDPALATQNTLGFAPPAPASFTVNKLELDNGSLTGVVTGRSDFVFDSMNNVDFALQFAVDGILATPLPGRITVPTDYSGPILIYRETVNGGYLYGTNNLTNAANRPVLTFAQVPEPGTLALLALGLVSFAASRRRKQ